MRRSLAISLGLTLANLSLSPVHAHPDGHNDAVLPWQEATSWPDRIVATIDGDPATTLAVTWRTDRSVSETSAQIALARPDARFDREALSVPAQTEALDLSVIKGKGFTFEVSDNTGLPKTHHHSVRFDGLEPDTLYAYRVQGADGMWSEWFQTRTAPRDGPIRFIYLGDAQNNLDSHWPRVIREAFRTAPDARFILHAGDLVNRGSRDLEWANWFKAGGFIHGMIPAIGVTGNHEYDDFELSNEEEVELLSILWRPQFRFPVETGLSPELHETVYSIRYAPDLEIFVLNTNIEDMSEQAVWLDAKLAASDARWRVVTMHHPIFSSGRGRDNPESRARLLPILLKHEVDLVLQGHDHTYARGTLPAGAARGQTPVRQAATNKAGVMTMFVNSVSGAKMYPFNKDGWDRYAPNGVTLDRKGENTQFFQVIELEDGQLHYAAYSADGALYDEFRLEKSADGSKALANTATLPPERTFENTLPYEKLEE
ncbi:MAG: FN3 domain-containing metallophosphoesterase family protein [Erythrobacter sp.]|uniref:FN3 domain-containing metallophosphoesterase family protein n=1 Tax=Erythrobacter sp. TaxID=1042 RepID=UPI002623D311|nr:FN3 domain-containing metallophosphoesterase family protein [Erythrobacter sp.]MDJ0979059.1 FN3 domain-containing metallophosphoesterase family protein [Erythrobacter sp.]